MEELEQPALEDSGSNEKFGKFKNAESLIKAYNSLEAEFTKKSQRLSQLESEKSSKETEANKRAEIDKRVDDFVAKYDIAMPFSSALKESLASDESLNLGEEAVKLIAKDYKRAEDYVCDDEFLNKYIYSNKEIKDKIVKDYLSKISQDSPIKLESTGNILLSTPKVPTTIQEAGRLAKTIIKQK